MSYKLQLKKGRAVEREHLDFYHKIKKEKKLPSDKKFTEGIAKAHLKEDSKYYDKLQKAGL
jgi:hypothetical protein